AVPLLRARPPPVGHVRPRGHADRRPHDEDRRQLLPVDDHRRDLLPLVRRRRTHQRRSPLLGRRRERAQAPRPPRQRQQQRPPQRQRQRQRQRKASPLSPRTPDPLNPSANHSWRRNVR